MKPHSHVLDLALPTPTARHIYVVIRMKDLHQRDATCLIAGNTRLVKNP